MSRGGKGVGIHPRSEHAALIREAEARGWNGRRIIAVADAKQLTEEAFNGGRTTCLSPLNLLEEQATGRADELPLHPRSEAAP